MTEVGSFVRKIFLYNDVAYSLRNKSGGSKRRRRIASRRTEQDYTVVPLKLKIEKVISQEQKRKRKKFFNDDDASKGSRLLPNLSGRVLRRKIYDDNDYNNNNTIKRARVTESRKRKAT